MSAAVTAGGLFYRQHNLAVRASAELLQSNRHLIEAVELREIVRELHRSLLSGESLSPEAIARFRKLSLDRPADEDERATLEKVRSDFESYVSRYSSRPRADDPGFREAYTKLISDVDRIVALERQNIADTTARLNEQQQQFVRNAAFGFLLFFLAASIVGIKMLGLITRPLSSLIRFLDDINIEEDLPASGPNFNSNLPEVRRVLGSLEGFLKKIWGYRALNIRRLLLEKQRADLIAASISDGILLLNGDQILYANSVAERILGVAPGLHVRGKRLPELVTGLGEVPQRIGIPAAHVIMEAVSRSIPLEFSVQVDDRTLFYLIHARPVYSPDSADSVDPASSPSDDLLKIEDGEDQRSFEFGAGDGEAIESRENHDSPDGLERFRATTLVVAQDVTLVRESQDAKGHFLATLSHEIKTPVTSLTMATRLLHKLLPQFTNPTHQSLITTCVEDVDRLRSLLGDLLNVSSFDTLTQRMEIQNVDIGRLVKHSVQSFKPQARERGIEMTCDVILSNRKAIVIPMDPTKIAWAISNLLTNGLRHTPRGGRVSVLVEATEEYAEVHVRDSGPGIDRKRLGQIFEKFNSFYDIRVARSGGAGVGLSIAREIVTAHKGRIWATSEPGQGAEFCFALPFKGGQAPSAIDNSGRGELTQAQTGQTVKGAAGGTSACS